MITADATPPTGPIILPPGIRLVMARELRANLRSFIVWLVPLAGLMLLTISLQPSMSADDGLLAAKIETMPEAMRKAFGIALLDFGQPASYLAVNFLYVTLVGSLFPGLLGASLLAKEETMGTAEMLLTQPVSRTQVVLGKAAALAVYALSFHLVLCVLAIATFAAIVDGDIQAGLIASLFCGSAALALCFGGAGLLMATLVRKARSATGLALGAVFGTYLLGVTAGIAPPAEPLGWLSPYKRVEPAAIVTSGGLDIAAVTLVVAIGLAGGALALLRYRKRDIHA